MPTSKSNSSCFHRQVPTGCWCREGKTFPPELTLVFTQSVFQFYPQNAPSHSLWAATVAGHHSCSAGCLAGWNLIWYLWKSLSWNDLLCRKCPCLLFIHCKWLRNTWAFHACSSLGKNMVLSLTIKLFIRVFFSFLSIFLLVCLKHVTKKAFPWYILTDNFLCWYKFLAIFVIRLNGKLSAGLAPDFQMPVPMLSQEQVIRK